MTVPKKSKRGGTSTIAKRIARLKRQLEKAQPGTATYSQIKSALRLAYREQEASKW